VTFEFVSDDNVESLGKRLMRIRQDKELLLSDVANDIKIHEKYLAAIEAGDDTLFPDHVFKELFVKAYAEYLGVSLDDLLMRLPAAPPPTAEGAKVEPRPIETPEVVGRPTPIGSYRSEEEHRGGGKSFLVAGLVVVIVVLGFFLAKLTFDSHPPSKVVIPEAIPKSAPKIEPAIDSTTMLVDSTDTAVVSDSTAVDSSATITPPDSVLLLVVGKGRSWMRVRRDADTTTYEGMIGVNDTLWFAMQDSIYLRLSHGNAVDLYLNALPLKITDSRDTSVVSLWISRDNYLKYVDSSRLAP
jgi:transcriptional regulator with XRE-family HTH domain